MFIIISSHGVVTFIPPYSKNLNCILLLYNFKNFEFIQEICPPPSPLIIIFKDTFPLVHMGGGTNTPLPSQKSFIFIHFFTKINY